jgi:1,2-diacylglycerol 3-beta-glucosyltransferase
MLGRPYTWVKTSRSGATSTVRADPPPAALAASAPGTGG